MLIAETLFISAMVACAWYDLRERRIPNRLNVAIFAAGLLVRAVIGGAHGTFFSTVGAGLAGAGLGLALLIVPFAIRWMGAGDAKLCAAIGAWLGPEMVLWATLFGLAGGGLLAAWTLVTSGRQHRADVAQNLKVALFTLSAPVAPRRQKSMLLPVALPLCAAAVGALVYMGGMHA